MTSDAGLPRVPTPGEVSGRYAGSSPAPPLAPADEPLSDSDAAYARRLADFILDHIGLPYTADEAGRVLEVRRQPSDSDSMRICIGCGEPGVSIGAHRCELCGEEQIEPFRVGWDESD